MQKILINGGNLLQGSVPVSGSKNASLPIMAASILTNENLELENVPDLVDVNTMSAVLSSLGVNVTKKMLIQIVLHFVIQTLKVQ